MVSVAVDLLIDNECMVTECGIVIFGLVVD